MKHIKCILVVLLLGVTIVWLVVQRPWSGVDTLFKMRSEILNYTGYIAIWAMSVGMILSLRATRFETFLGGLDKAYRLHKWLGVTALIVGVLHWFWGFAPKHGWINLGQSPHGAHGRTLGHGGEAQNVFQQLLSAIHEPAEVIGEWAFYVAAVLIVIALIKRVPWRHFLTTHRILAITYLLLAFHAFGLMRYEQWFTPLAPLTFVVLIGGVVAAFTGLSGRIGRSKKVTGTVESVQHSASNGVIAIKVKVPLSQWVSHKAGQYAFLRFSGKEGPHPFTISSAWQHDGVIGFHIKALGDFTRGLADKVKVGEKAVIEGPYGRFTFQSKKPRQIWVAGGVGITPFLARLEELGGVSQNGEYVDLFYSTQTSDTGFIDHLSELAKSAGVKLHVIDSNKDGFLDVDRISREVPGWKEATAWFCGPAGFGVARKKGFKKLGFDTDGFHQELFEMR